jgi:hypothetical protein
MSVSRWCKFVGVLVVAAMATTPARADLWDDLLDLLNLRQVVRIEEDWTLVVNQTNDLVASPQVSTQMSSRAVNGRFCNFHLNSRDVPNFQLGGLQLQVWNGTNNLAYINSSNTSVMSTPDELVTWTQYIRKESSSLYFGIGTKQEYIPGASSTTWGDFSSVETVIPGGSASLSQYTPVYSQQHSGVTFGANRVQALVLTQVRVYYDNNDVETDYTPRVIYSQTLDPELNPDGTPGQ